MANDEQKYPHLTEEDIDKIVEKVCDKIENRLYNNVGSGIVGLVWRGMLLGLIALAAYGVVGQVHWFK